MAGGAILKYLAANHISAIASYGYNNYISGLNGGVNVDSIRQITSNVDLLLYDNLQAPVVYRSRKMNVLQHNLGLRLLADSLKYFRTDLSFYYRFDRNEVKNPEDAADYPQKDKNKTGGVLLRQNVRLAFADLDILAQYEKTNAVLYIPGSYVDINTSSFTLSPVFSLTLADSSIVPSFFYKIQNISNVVSKVYNGLGFDISLNLLKRLKLYGGYSVYKSAELTNNVNTIELSAKLELENLKLGADFIHRSESNISINPSFFINGDEYRLELGTSQIGGNVSFRYWNILLEASGYYDLSNHKSLTEGITAAEPKIRLTGGIYFAGKFFEDNLDLKTGFAMNYNSKQRIFSSGNEIDLAGQFTTVDYTLTGEIQKVAYAYFTWENLFDETYYIVPYYPMFRRGIRFGVAWELFN